MSDKKLVELIRSAPWSDGFPYLKETADRIEELEAKLAKAVEALIWCSGHPDFNEGGTCREGWSRVCAPTLEELKSNAR